MDATTHTTLSGMLGAFPFGPMLRRSGMVEAKFRGGLSQGADGDAPLSACTVPERLSWSWRCRMEAGKPHRFYRRPISLWKSGRHDEAGISPSAPRSWRAIRMAFEHAWGAHLVVGGDRDRRQLRQEDVDVARCMEARLTHQVGPRGVMRGSATKIMPPRQKNSAKILTRGVLSLTVCADGGNQRAEGRRRDKLRVGPAALGQNSEQRICLRCHLLFVRTVAFSIDGTINAITR